MSDPKFGVGQVVHHLRYDYRGAIVDLDTTCQADESWYERQVKGKDYRPTRDQPWYHVLVHGASHMTYVAEQNLELDPEQRPIEHPLRDRIFKTFLGGRYYKEALS